MELVEYIQIFRKWLWVLILAALLGGGVSYLVISRRPARYEATALIEVGGFMQSPNPESSEIRTGVELAQTYVVLAETYDILQASIDAEDFALTPKELDEIIEAETIAGTSLLKITATYTDPILTADVANAVARQIIRNSPTHLTVEQEQQVLLINNEIASLSAQLQAARVRLDAVDALLEDAEEAADIANLRAQRSVLVTEINETSATLAQFTSTIASLQARVNSLDMVEQARIPDEPVGPGALSMAVLGSMVSLSLAAGVVLLADYLDDTLKTSEQVMQHVALPVLGKISNYRQRGRQPQNPLIAHTDPTLFVAEEYRALRTQLLFATDDDELHTIFTSASPDDGKSVTVANLAVTLAAASYRVLLIDADLRRPVQHQLFGLNNGQGLTTLLAKGPQDALVDAGHLVFARAYEGCIKETEIAGLRILTSGPMPANPAEALGSNFLRLWFEVFRNAVDVDVILVDTPPVLAVADASVIATTTGLPIVLVLRAGKTRRAAAVEARAQLAQLGLKLQGAVLNDVKPHDRQYGRSYYYSYYGPSADTIASRDTVDVVRVPSTNGRRLPLQQPETAHLDGRPSLPLETIRNLKPDKLLLLISGNKEPLIVDVPERITLGRLFDDAKHNHVALDAYNAHQLGVSRAHAAVHRRDDTFFLEDLGSANGTWLNNQCLSPGENRELLNSDSVRLGDLQLWVYFRAAQDDTTGGHDIPQALGAKKAD